MAIYSLQDLPNIYKSEWAKFDELTKTYPITTVGAYSFTSESSGILYSTVNGGLLDIFTQLQTVLLPYILNANRWNSIQSEINPMKTIFTTTGTSPNYLVTVPNTTTFNLTSGQPIIVKFHSASVVASTLNVNGLGAIPIKKPNGNNFTSISANGVYTFLYDSGNFILQGEGGEYGTATAPQVLAPYTFGTETGLATGTMPNRTGDTVALSSTISGTTLKFLASNGYRNGTTDYVTKTDAGYIASNIIQGASIFGLSGTTVPKAYYMTTGPSITGSNVISAGGTSTTFSVSLSGFSFTPRTVIVEAYSTSYFSTNQLTSYAKPIYSLDYAFTYPNPSVFTQISSNSYTSTHTINSGSTTLSNGSATISITYSVSPAVTTNSVCTINKIVLLP